MIQKVISFHYTLTNKDGKTLDSSRGQEPLIFLQGSGQIIPGLEAVLVTLNRGDQKDVHVPYRDGYGPYNQQLVQKVPRNKFPAGPIEVGDTFQIGKDNYHQVVSVIEVTDATVTIDANHPLAGQDLNFAVEIIDIRDATVEEVAHGHIHGAGGHHH